MEPNSVIIATIARMTPSDALTKRPMTDTSPLHPLNLRILLALRGEPLHGYRLVKEIEERHGSAIQPANLYRRIRRLRDEGLVEEVAAPHDAPDARERKFFTLTEAGRGALATEVRRMRELLEEAGALVPGEGV